MPLILSTQAGKEVIRYNNRGINFTLRFSSLWANSSRPAPTRFKLSGKNKGAKAALKSGTFLPLSRRLYLASGAKDSKLKH
jgi:hypothetical protein